MTSVAYGVSPAQRTGWIRTGASLILGWVVSYAALGVLIVAGGMLGVLNPSGRGWDDIFTNEPFPSSGAWSFAANAAAVAIVLLVSAVLTAAVLRDRIGDVSEWRLLGVLALTGWAPFLSAASGVLGFIIATWLVRSWALAGADRLPRRRLVALGVLLALVVCSYGLLHPLSTPSGPASVSGRDVIVELDNGGRATVTIERISGGLVVDRIRGAKRKIPGGSSTMVSFHVPRSACASVLPDVRVAYRLLGASFSQRLVISVPEPLRCP